MVIRKKNEDKKMEIMAPVGSYESLSAAIKAGANSVYFGIGKLNMRARSAVNFALNDLEKISRICREKNVKTYLTLNTVMYDEDLKEIEKICQAVKKNKINAVIACDMAVIEYARSIGVEVHMSTQTNISNIEAVKFYSNFADVIVLARELTLEQIKKICGQIKKRNIKGPNGKLVKVEIFVHGALCVSISGKCYMSLALYNSSANRGSCYQSCRRKYRVTDEETGDELSIDNNYIMSPKDLCTIGSIDKFIEAGVNVFKIEGRGRSPDYVYSVVKAYKEAVESYYAGNYTKEKIKKWIKELESVFNRGFWQGGYYLGKKAGEWAGTYGSNAEKEKHFIGIIKHSFPKAKCAEIEIQKEELDVGDEILITGEKTGVVKYILKSIFVNAKSAKSADKNSKDVSISVPEIVRKNDKVYVLKKRD